MKNIYNLFFLAVAMSVLATGCKKFDVLDVYGPGKAVVLSGDATDIAPSPSDSDNVVLTLQWTNPEYATDPATYKYVIEIDEVGNNFSKASKTTVIGLQKREFRAREINMMLSGFGFFVDEKHDMEVRVASSYANNNELYYSNILPISMTAYLDPTNTIDATTMFIIGDAALGWDVDAPMNLIGEKSFATVVSLASEKEFKFRRDAGSWDINWGLESGVAFEFGKPLAIRLGGDNFKIPAGPEDQYQVLMDLVSNTATITPVPSTMNIIGDGAVSWDTDVPMDVLGNGNYSVVTDLVGTKEIKFRSVPGSWDVNWGTAPGATFALGVDVPLARDGGNIPVPADGKYKVTINLANNTYKITENNFPTQLFLVGGGTPADWNPSNSLPFTQVDDGVFEIYSPITENGEFKFLQVQDWAGDWGDSKVTPGTLEQADEQNCKVAEAGFYRITVDFKNNTWTALKTDWGLIGSATPGGWDNDTDMVKDGHFVWVVTLDLGAGEIKFRANDGWDINLGDNDADGSLEYGGSNIAVPEAGNYTVRLDFDPNGYSYSVTKN